MMPNEPKKGVFKKNFYLLGERPGNRDQSEANLPSSFCVPVHKEGSRVTVRVRG